MVTDKYEIVKMILLIYLGIQFYNNFSSYLYSFGP